MDYVTYIKLPAYEREWCETHFGKPCEFTRGTNLNSIIRHFMRKRPDSAPPEIKQPGETAIVLVSSASKKVETYNYISKPGKEAIAKAIDDLFVMHMWEDLTGSECRNIQINKLVLDWMEANGISRNDNNFENLRMKFQRIKDTYRKKHNLNISRGYKHENQRKKGNN